MKKGRLLLVVFVASWFLRGGQLFGERRFPPPDFESGYTQPPLTFQEVRRGWNQYADVVFMVCALGLAVWFLHTKRNRSALYLLGVVCLLYFGFFKEGCVCPIGSIQNVTLGFVDPNYKISIPVLAFFVLPLLFALIWGRVFCGAVCPLGAIQDLFLFRSVRVPLWLEGPLGLLRYFYLGLAVFFVVEFNRFVICEYDPFVSFFRFNGPFWRLATGAGFLLVGLFVARPYCRYLCPYGALLSLCSRGSSVPVRITPESCINCTLCDATCPFEAIRRPESTPAPSPRFLSWVFLVSVCATIGFPVLGYYALGKRLSGLFLGLWFGGVIAAKLFEKVPGSKRSTYEADRAACLACARCYQWCPEERARWEPLTTEERHAG